MRAGFAAMIAIGLYWCVPINGDGKGIEMDQIKAD